MLNDDMTEVSIEVSIKASIITWVLILLILSCENSWVHSTLPNLFLNWIEITQKTELLNSEYYSKMSKISTIWFTLLTLQILIFVSTLLTVILHVTDFLNYFNIYFLSCSVLDWFSYLDIKAEECLY